MATITLQDIRKEYGEDVAIANMNLDIRDGEFVTLVGPSGCGKSTTIEMIAGLTTPTSGTVAIGDRDVTALPPKDRGIAMVFQNIALFPHKNVYDNISFGLRLRDFPQDEMDDRVDEAARVVRMKGMLDRMPSEMSGGQRQRVAIARAIVRDPDVFLMDEPLSNLDAKLRAETRTELADLHDDIRTTTVYVTHDQTEAMTLGDRVAVMNEGEIEQVDPPQQLYDYPQTRFVAEFIGSPSMNLVAVEIAEGNGGYRAVHGEFSIPLPHQPGLDALGEGTGLLGIRPESFTLAQRSEADDHTIELTVELVESMGDTLVVHGRVGDDELQFVSYDAHRKIERGDTVEVAYDPERLHVFDPETGDAAYHSSYIENRSKEGAPKQMQGVESR